jgi:hypothetical protein
MMIRKFDDDDDNNNIFLKLTPHFSWLAVNFMVSVRGFPRRS